VFQDLDERVLVSDLIGLDMTTAGKNRTFAPSPTRVRARSYPPSSLVCRAVTDAKRGIAFAIAGLLILALNVIDAADRGASAGNIAAIAVGAGLLFYGFTQVARSGRPPSS
jgi:hypothetical protein